jgi:hypothetical protein
MFFNGRELRDFLRHVGGDARSLFVAGIHEGNGRDQAVVS